MKNGTAGWINGIKMFWKKKSDAYYVDEGLAEKFKSIFEIPGKDEIDVWVEQWKVGEKNE